MSREETSPKLSLCRGHEWLYRISLQMGTMNVSNKMVQKIIHTHINSWQDMSLKAKNVNLLGVWEGKSQGHKSL